MTTTEPTIARREGLVDHDPAAGQTTVYATADTSQPIALALNPDLARTIARFTLET